jgi:hypothetical protein
MTPADRFRGLSRTVFTGLEDILESHEVPARTRERAARRGALEWNGSTVVFEPDPAGFWTVLEEPSDEAWYCWGADSTTGKQTINDGVSLRFYNRNVITPRTVGFEGRYRF